MSLTPRLLLVGFAIAWLPSSVLAQPATVATGPQTESRFPSLNVPAGFKPTLFACDPLVEYPSVIALGPKFGTVFVAHDYVTGLGYEIVKRDEIRLLADTDGDGYADTSTLYAEGFNSIQGLAYHAGTVYAMHAPLLTALKDTDGDGKADERRDLLKGLGLAPEENQTRLHCANGVVVGHDGWLYLAMGDNGTNVLRPEGDRLILNAGGILRCRYDGRDLHVFSTGLRNIYDIALDDELNVFVRDNENDGGDYMIRVYHSFFGADHGYPYLYYEHPEETMQPLADLGRGSSAGIVCYLETAFPPEYRGNLFACEWGKSIVRYERKRQGSSFAPMKEIEFATGAPNDPYGFKPTDIIVDYDGSLLISDWCDGQRPKRGRGRIYRIAYSGNDEKPPAPPVLTTPTDIATALTQLKSSSYYGRVTAQKYLQTPEGRTAIRNAWANRELNLAACMHAVWILASSDADDAVLNVGRFAFNNDPAVNVQATRATADLIDPVFLQHQLKPVRVNEEHAVHFELFVHLVDDPIVFREAIIATARVHGSRLPTVVQRDPGRLLDVATAHAAQQALRRHDAWKAVLEIVRSGDLVRQVALGALADRYDAAVVDALIEGVEWEHEKKEFGGWSIPMDLEPDFRQQIADLLTRVYKKPSEWKYWGYRPGPRPANTVAWERTEAIEQALDRVLADPDRGVRLAILKRMQREQIPVRLVTLERWLTDERNSEAIASILASLSKFPADDIRDVLALVIRGRDIPVESRRQALILFIAGLTPDDSWPLLEFARRLEDGPVLVDLLTHLGKGAGRDSPALLVAKLNSAFPEIRAAAIAACAELLLHEATPRVSVLLDDPDAGVRRAAAFAAGALAVKDTSNILIKLTLDRDPAVRSASLDALRKLREAGAVSSAMTALDHPITQLAAIEYLADFGNPEHAAPLSKVAATNRSSETLVAIVRAMSQWEQREPPGSPRRQDLLSRIAVVQGQSGVVLRWQVAGPMDRHAALHIREDALPFPAVPAGSQPMIGSGAEARVRLDAVQPIAPDAVYLAVADISVADATKAQFLASSNTTLQVWLNGKAIHQRAKSAAFQADSERFNAQLNQGMNRIVVELGSLSADTQFHLRFRPLSSSAEHERLTQYALANTGSADRGRELFLNADKTLCVKCHRLGEQGGNIGPILTGVGRRFARIHLIESILEPSRTIAPSYDTISVALNSGRVVNGVKIAEDDVTLTLGDDKGERHAIAKADIDERVTQRRSTMPEGLEKRFTDREFLDLLTFLTQEK